MMVACKYKSTKKWDSKWGKEETNLEKASPSIVTNVKIKYLQGHTPDKHREEIKLGDQYNVWGRVYMCM